MRQTSSISTRKIDSLGKYNSDGIRNEQFFAEIILWMVISAPFLQVYTFLSLSFSYLSKDFVFIVVWVKILLEMCKLNVHFFDWWVLKEWQSLVSNNLCILHSICLKRYDNVWRHFSFIFILNSIQLVNSHKYYKILCSTVILVVYMDFNVYYLGCVFIYFWRVTLLPSKF